MPSIFEDLPKKESRFSGIVPSKNNLLDLNIRKTTE